MKHYTCCIMLAIVHLSMCPCLGGERISSSQPSLEFLADGLDRVVGLWRDGKLENALEESSRIEACFGPDPLLYAQRSGILEEMGRVDEAEQAGLKIIQEEPGGYVFMIRFYNRHGRDRDARQLLTDAFNDDRVALHPTLPATLHGLAAQRLLSAGSYDEALQECETALEMAPDIYRGLRKTLMAIRASIIRAMEGQVAPGDVQTWDK